MAATVAQVKSVVMGRAGRQLALVGLGDADLDDPIRSALGSLGLAPAGLAPVADADLAAVGPAMLAALVDLAELRALESVLGNWTEPDQVADTDNSQALGKLRDSLEKTVARKRLQVERAYGIGLPELAAGVLDLGFAETVDPATGWPR